eukprot:TRINITY_DN1616_c1_g1_i2.p1 TRINITY_DN1616_c1_g1~~TRINITY_DN1616_c1_g1_i2.p1  ORF type:complete len:536 (+),score=197.85 TRINITY_DN1616_c1_g1_i2:74-1681(+)
MDKTEEIALQALKVIELGQLDNLKQIIDSIKSKIDKQIIIDYKEKERGETGLHKASKLNKVRIALYLLQQDASVNLVDKDGNTPCHLAVIAGHDAMVIWLFKKGANITTLRNNYSKTVIDYASPKLIQILQGLNSTLLRVPSHFQNIKTSREDREALYSAVQFGNFTQLKNLIETKFYSDLTDVINERSIEGKNLLHLCCEHNYVEIAAYLLSKGANPNAEEEYANTPLIINALSCQGDERLTELLIKNGAIANCKSMFGLVPIILATDNGFIKVIQTLFELGKADLSAQDNLGNTTLHVAARRGHLEIVKWLLQNGINANLTNKNGENAFQLAINTEIRSLIKKAIGVEDSNNENEIQILKEKELFQLQEMQNSIKNINEQLQINELVGEGNFCQVFKAIWHNQLVAVKKLSVASKITHKNTLINDVYLLNKIDENVLRLFAANILTDEPVGVYEWLGGGNLSRIMLSRQFNQLEQLNCFLQIAKGMAYIHDIAQIIHCDLRCSNIMIDNDSTKYKICDFGLSVEKSKINKIEI